MNITRDPAVLREPHAMPETDRIAPVQERFETWRDSLAHVDERLE